MKKTIVIFSFILITVFSTGSFFLHKSYLKSYKKEFKSFLLENKKYSNYVTIKINPSELYTNSKSIIWEDENKEVIYNGKLYDIVCIKKTGVKIELVAISDEQEMELKKQFASVYDIDSLKKTKEPLSLLKNFFSLKYLHSNKCLNIKNPEPILRIIFNYLSFQPSKGFITHPSPPPKNFA